MRRRGSLLVLAMVATACTPQGRPTQLGTPADPREAATQAAAADAVDRFLHAYAAVPTDGGSALREIAGSAAVEHWASWLGVQYAQIGGVTGAVDIRSVGVAEAVRGIGVIDRLLVVPIEASVTFTIPRTTEGPVQQTRVLDGPVVLAPDVDGAWKVADFARDGVLLSASVFVFDAGSSLASVTDRGVTITVDSFISDATRWAVGVLVRNDTDRDIRITDSTVALVDVTGSLVLSGSAPEGLETVEPRSTEEALVAFRIPAEEELVGLRLFVGALVGPSDPIVYVVIPVQPILRALSAAASPTPGPSPGGTA